MIYLNFEILKAEIKDRVVAYAKQYLEFLSIVPEMLRADGPNALEKF